MSLVDQLLGRPVRETATGDVVPVAAGKQRLPVRREPPKDKEEDKLRANARRSSVVAHIMGMSESDDEAIIPDTAKALDPYSAHQIPGLTSRDPTRTEHGPTEPSVTNIHGEELIPPSAALVAPDVTPNVMQPLDPSQVPAPAQSAQRPAPPSQMPQAGPVEPIQPSEPVHANGNRSALDTILGRQNREPQPNAAAMAMAEQMMNEAVNGTIQERVAAKIIPAGEGGDGMPLHKESDGRTIFNQFRKFNG